jgi:hypothetical protein
MAGDSRNEYQERKLQVLYDWLRFAEEVERLTGEPGVLVAGRGISAGGLFLIVDPWVRDQRDLPLQPDVEHVGQYAGLRRDGLDQTPAAAYGVRSIDD